MQLARATGVVEGLELGVVQHFAEAFESGGVILAGDDFGGIDAGHEDGVEAGAGGGAGASVEEGLGDGLFGWGLVEFGASVNEAGSGSHWGGCPK